MMCMIYIMYALSTVDNISIYLFIQQIQKKFKS
jgi:hypothetical protein